MSQGKGSFFSLAFLVCTLTLKSIVLAQSDQGAGAVNTIAPELSVTDVAVSILGQDGSTDDTFTASYPKQILSFTGLTLRQSLEITLSVQLGGETFKPQQLMLMLKPLSGSIAAYSVGKPKRGGTYSLVIGAAALEKQGIKQGGAFEVVLLVGDPSVPKGLTWSLGTVELPAPNDASPVPPYKTATSQIASSPKPVIEHMHRPPVKQPPQLISLVFAALSFLPLVIAIGAAFQAGANFKGLPKEGQGFLYMVAFHGGIGAMLVLYLIFWLKLNLVETLPPALLLGVFVALAGYKTLSTLASARLKKD